MKNEERQFVVLATIGWRFLVNVLSPKLLFLFTHCLRKSMKKGAAILRNSLIS